MKFTVYHDAPGYIQPQEVEAPWEKLSQRLTQHTATTCGKKCVGHKCPEKAKHGAWSPIKLIPGSTRNNPNVLAVTAVVLDIDNIEEAEWNGVANRLEENQVAFTMHTTHAHTAKKFSARLVIPIDREILPHEWKTVRANVVARYQIPTDKKTLDISRIFYVPTSPEGGLTDFAEFGFDMGGQPIRVDGFLEGLEAAPEPVRPAAPAATSEFPPASIELLGQIASFCKNVIGPAVDGDGGGKTAVQVGSLLYNDWALSDEQAWVVALEWNTTNRPPWKESEYDDLRQKLENGRKYAKGDHGSKRREHANLEMIRAEFCETPTARVSGEIPESEETEDEQAWQGKLLTITLKTGTTAFKSCGYNVFLVLAHSKQWRNVFRLNRLTNTVEVWGGPFGDPERPLPLADSMVTKISNWLEASAWRLSSSTQGTYEQLQAVAELNGYDPLFDYVNALQWDGVPRLDSWLVTYLKASTVNALGEDISKHVSTVGAKWMIGAMARAKEPGCKLDSVLVLEGAQNLGKSTALRILGGPFFCDAPLEVGSKEAMMLAGKRWIVELAEIDALRKHESAEVKRFFTQMVDEFRPAYGRAMVTSLRRCAMAGSSNRKDYLQDETGNRRYWPVECSDDIDLDALRRDRDQLWAEARVRYEAGEHWYLNKEEYAAAEAETAARISTDSREELVLEWWLAKGKPQEFSLTDMVQNALGITPDKMNHGLAIQLGRVATLLGFERQRRRVNNALRWVYVPNDKLNSIPQGTRIIKRADDKSTNEGLMQAVASTVVKN